MAINLGGIELTEEVSQMLDMLNSKDYAGALKLIQKEQNRIYKENYRIKKSLGNEEIEKYILEKETSRNKEELKTLSEFRKLVKKAQKKPAAVRLNSKIIEFNIIQKKRITRGINIKESGSRKIYYSNYAKEVIEIFLTRGFLKHPAFLDKIGYLPGLESVIYKYFGEDFKERLRDSLQTVKPTSMSGDVADKVFSLSEEYIKRIKKIEPKNDEEVKELSYAIIALEKLLGE